MTLSMMKDLKELHNQIIEQKHHDADYILRLLYHEKAFLFVAMPIPLAYGSKEAISSQEEGQSSVSTDDVNDNIEERFRALEYLDEAHKNYKEMKLKLQQKGTISSDRSFSAISDGLITDIASELQKFDDWKRTRCQKHVLERKTGTSLSLPDTASAASDNSQTTTDTAEINMATATTADKGNSSKSSRIKDIKKRSFSSVSKVTRGMRHLQPSKESTEGSEAKKKRRKK